MLRDFPCCGYLRAVNKWVVDCGVNVFCVHSCAGSSLQSDFRFIHRGFSWRLSKTTSRRISARGFSWNSLSVQIVHRKDHWVYLRALDWKSTRDLWQWYVLLKVKKKCDFHSTHSLTSKSRHIAWRLLTRDLFQRFEQVRRAVGSFLRPNSLVRISGSDLAALPLPGREPGLSLADNWRI